MLYKACQVHGFNSSIGLTAVLTSISKPERCSRFNSSIGLTAVLTCVVQYRRRLRFNSSIGLTAVLTMSEGHHSSRSLMFQFLNRTNRCSDSGQGQDSAELT